MDNSAGFWYISAIVPMNAHDPIQPVYPIGGRWSLTPPLPPAPLIASENIMEAGARKHVETACWQLDYAFSPCGRYKIGAANNPWQTRPAHTSHLYPPGTKMWQDTTSLRNRSLHFAFVVFRGEEPFLRCLVRNRQGYATILDPDGQIGALLSAMAAIAGTLHDAGFWQGQGKFCEALELLRHVVPISDELYRLPSLHIHPRESSLGRTVEACLRRNLGDPPTAPSIAKELHMGVSTLLHRFRRETGEPLMKHIMRLRLNLAMELLLQGHPGKAVAEQLGFCDESHFSKTFHRVEGMTPSAYVNAVREGRLIPQNTNS